MTNAEFFKRKSDKNNEKHQYGNNQLIKYQILRSK